MKLNKLQQQIIIDLVYDGVDVEELNDNAYVMSCLRTIKDYPQIYEDVNEYVEIVKAYKEEH